MSSAPTVSERPLAYIDSSAFAKLVLAEAESDQLRDYLDTANVALISSALLRVETSRALRRVASREALRELTEAFEEIAMIAVSERILRRAGELEPKQLCTLDAIHLATALDVHADEMIVYDRRLAGVARGTGIKVASPRA